MAEGSAQFKSQYLVLSIYHFIYIIRGDWNVEKCK